MEPMSAVKARKLGFALLTQAMERNVKLTFQSYDRLFPNQDYLPEGGLGNLVALPLQGQARKLGNSVFVDEDFVAFKEQWSYLQQIVKITENEVDTLLQKKGILTEMGDLSTTSDSTPWKILEVQPFTRYDFPRSLTIIRSNQIYVPLKHFSSKVLAHLKRVASFKNPEFYARQGMRLSIYNIPRVICCAEVLEDYLALPRGCEDALIDVLKAGEVSSTYPNFAGTMENTAGRIFGIGISYRRNGSEAGKKKHFSPFGTLDSKGNSLHGWVDVALMQSCLTDEGVKPFVRQYGMVIVDECHHVSAVNFEQILKSIPARYVYGLTATPIRKDGHQPIIFMQCGPIRYSAEAKSQLAKQTFKRWLIPRFTAYRDLSDSSSTYAQIVQSLATDEARNALIVEDVCKTLAVGRSQIVLTTLTSHVEQLSQLLSTCCKNIITLVGSESMKDKRQKMERLAELSPKEPLVVVATGRYVGEGFDYPRLDTLFLVSPVSWKGIIAQYAGRLHREYHGKTDVRIYDYIDIRLPLCERMYQRRLKGYAAIGYQLLENEPSVTEQHPQSLFSGNNYQASLVEHISQAKHSVLIAAMKSGLKKQSGLWRALKEAICRGVQVVVFVKHRNEQVEWLQREGFAVYVSESLTLQLVVIDKKDIWYGSINFIGYATEEDCAVRFSDKQLATEMIDILYGE